MIIQGTNGCAHINLPVIFCCFLLTRKGCNKYSKQGERSRTPIIVPAIFASRTEGLSSSLKIGHQTLSTLTGGNNHFTQLSLARLTN
jgi:hypothetical protein